MKDPALPAYDDPRSGKDPQPAHDNGGVHLISGIPTEPRVLSRVGRFRGLLLRKGGEDLVEDMNSGRVPPRCTFLQFADVTVDIAEEAFGDDVAKIVRSAWNEVGFVRKNQYFSSTTRSGRALQSHSVE